MTEQTHDDEFRWPLLAALLYETPLMISPQKADIIHNILQGYAAGHPPALSADMLGQRRERKPYAVTPGGVALVSVMGSLVHRGGSLDALSGLTSYRRLSAELGQAARDPDVKAIMLDVDSAGGSVAGLFDLTARIVAINSEKPVWAISNESMFSAAYAIGASAGRVVAPQTAMAGSIGVIMMHLDRSEADRKAGRKYTPIYAGHHKIDGSQHAPISDRAFATYQSIVDQNYQVFVSHVAQGRGLAEQAVIDTQAQIYTAADARDVGLIDEIAAFDDAVTMLESSLRSSVQVSLNRAAARNSEDLTMSQEKQAASDAAFTQADIDAARKAAHDEGLQAGRDDERQRVTAIIDHQKAAANFAQAANAIKTGLTVEQAVGVLDGMPDNQAGAGDQFGAIMTGLGNPAVAVDGAADESEFDIAATAKHAVALIQPN